MTRGIIIAAPASGSGKTTLTLALLRHLRQAGVAVASLKIGPDYIDPAFHCAASGRPCLNLDLWAMRPSTVQSVMTRAAEQADWVIAEGVMGLFDGAVGDAGSTADAARATGWPVVLVVDASGMAASVAAVVRGFATHRPDVRIAGVIFNRVGSQRHHDLLVEAVAELDVAVLGSIKRDPSLALPDRHLGLVQATEHETLEQFLNDAAKRVGESLDIDALLSLGVTCPTGDTDVAITVPPPGQHIAVASDVAFGFSYQFMLDGWRAAGAEVSTFSPLADESPGIGADAVFLPGGYPELHAGRLASNQNFMRGLRDSAARGAMIYGECGGYMVLGDGLVDAHGTRHAMAGLLPLETSFEHRKLSLGYRDVEVIGAGMSSLHSTCRTLWGHEFHFATTLKAPAELALFRCKNARGEHLGDTGLQRANVLGSFIHLLDARA